MIALQLTHDLQSKTGLNDSVLAFLRSNNIAPLLEFIQSTGVYQSRKVESFIHQNELLPQAQFVALINSMLEKNIFNWIIYIF